MTHAFAYLIGFANSEAQVLGLRPRPRFFLFERTKGLRPWLFAKAFGHYPTAYWAGQLASPASPRSLCLRGAKQPILGPRLLRRLVLRIGLLGCRPDPPYGLTAMAFGLTACFAGPSGLTPVGSHFGGPFAEQKGPSSCSPRLCRHGISLGSVFFPREAMERSSNCLYLVDENLRLGRCLRIGPKGPRGLKACWGRDPPSPLIRNGLEDWLRQSAISETSVRT